MYSTENSLYFDLLDTSNTKFKKAYTFGKWKETTASILLRLMANNVVMMMTGLGYSDFAYNAKRDLFAYASITGRIGYYLFDCWDPKIIRKAKWQLLQKGSDILRYWR